MDGRPWKEKLCRVDGERCDCESLGYTSITMLQFLKGQPWDDRARNLVHALRPSSVRTSTGSLNTDAETWRVTVMLSSDRKTIRSITQEVEVGGRGCGERIPGMAAGDHLHEIGVKTW